MTHTCTENLTRAVLRTMVEGVLAVLWPPGNISRKWGPETAERVSEAIQPALIDAWLDEVEHEDLLTLAALPQDPPEPPPLAPLVLQDRAAVWRWIDAMRIAVADADGVISDALRPLGERQLGRVPHVQNYRDAKTKLVDLLAVLEAGIR